MFDWRTHSVFFFRRLKSVGAGDEEWLTTLCRAISYPNSFQTASSNNTWTHTRLFVRGTKPRDFARFAVLRLLADAVPVVYGSVSLFFPPVNYLSKWNFNSEIGQKQVLQLIVICGSVKSNSYVAIWNSSWVSNSCEHAECSCRLIESSHLISVNTPYSFLLTMTGILENAQIKFDQKFKAQKTFRKCQPDKGQRVE